jgi:hypothetical protein
MSSHLTFLEFAAKLRVERSFRTPMIDSARSRMDQSAITASRASRCGMLIRVIFERAAAVRADFRFASEIVVKVKVIASFAV